MVVTGKTGADAIFGYLHKICAVLQKYEVKLLAVVAAAEAAGAISSDDAAKISAFITVASATCDAFSKLAAYSGF